MRETLERLRHRFARWLFARRIFQGVNLVDDRGEISIRCLDGTAPGPGGPACHLIFSGPSSGRRVQISFALDKRHVEELASGLWQARAAWYLWEHR